MLEQVGFDIVDRIASLRSELLKRGLDAFVVPRFDAHQGEYIAPHDERLAWITGFTGSAGVAIVTQEDVALFVDGRYGVQARDECGFDAFSHHHIFDDPPESWLADVPNHGWRIGFDPMHIPPRWYDRFWTALASAGAELVPVSDNPVDAVWIDQPAPPKGQVEIMPLQVAGQAAVDKLDDLHSFLDESDAQFLVETQPDNIAWLLNVRGADVPYMQAPHSNLLVQAGGNTTWFVDRVKLLPEVQDALPDRVEIKTPEAFLETIRTSVQPGQHALIDADFSPVAVRQVLRDRAANVRAAPSYLTRKKARKNEGELEGLRACHVQDGIAMTEFSAWLQETVPVRAATGDPVTEWEAEQKVLEFRTRASGFLNESFRTISAAGSNAAMCHYATRADRSPAILPTLTYLIDSGGQYETGTTDITRSFAFGARPDGYDRAYTAVFKAFHSLLTLRFPKGTQGHHIDAICRRPLWDLGLDYDHGTGHGIGHRLSVHEHPQRIGKPVNPVDLGSGMVMSIEPGHYVADLYGIRIENLFEIVDAADGFMAFRNITWVPIQTKMLIQSTLTDAERGWLSDYHAEIEQRLLPFLSDRAASWCRQNRMELQ